MRSFKRSQRIADQIKRDAAEIVAEKLLDSTQAMVTVSRVEVTDDLRNAKIFYTVLGDDPELLTKVKSALEHSAGHIQSELAHKLRIRRMPDISFHYDTSLVEGMRIANLIDRIMSEQQGDEE